MPGRSGAAVPNGEPAGGPTCKPAMGIRLPGDMPGRWYCAAGPAGPMGRKAVAPGPPTPPAGPGPLSAGPGNMPGPAGGGGAPRAAATAPLPGLRGGSGNPPAPRPDIVPSRPAVSRSGSGLRTPCRVRSAFRAPGLPDLNSGFWDLLIRVPGFPNLNSRVPHRPGLGQGRS